MRTTLDIDDDLLAVTKLMAAQQGVSAGAMVSRLLRQALCGAPPPGVAEAPAPYSTGFQPFASRGQPVTDAVVDQLRDVEGV